MGGRSEAGEPARFEKVIDMKFPAVAAKRDSKVLHLVADVSGAFFIVSSRLVPVAEWLIIEAKLRWVRRDV